MSRGFSRFGCWERKSAILSRRILRRVATRAGEPKTLGWSRSRQCCGERKKRSPTRRLFHVPHLTWAEKTEGPSSRAPATRTVVHGVKASEKGDFRPMDARANMGPRPEPWTPVRSRKPRRARLLQPCPSLSVAIANLTTSILPRRLALRRRESARSA